MFKKSKMLHGLALLLLLAFFTGCADDDSQTMAEACTFDGPAVFGRCTVSGVLCVEFHDGGVGSSVCQSQYSGTWEEGQSCNQSGITSKCHVDKDAANSQEWIEFRYDDNDPNNQVLCGNWMGQWCDK